MTDNFKCIYHILTTLEKAMDYEKIDISEIGYEHLGISKNRWVKYLEMMSDMELIKGISFREYVDGSTEVINDNIRITLKGLEYLSENSIMQRLYNAASGVVNVVSAIK